MPTPNHPDPQVRESVELLRRAQGGDGAALDQLLERDHPRVLAMVRARLGEGLRRSTESSDVVQEAMSQAIQSFERFEPRDEDALLRWLSALVENRLRDLAKYHGRGKREAGREVRLESVLRDMGSAGTLGAPGDSSDTPLARIEHQEESQRVLAALSALDPRMRAVLELRSKGIEWTAVARELELAGVPAARSLHARAMMALMKACDVRPPS